MTTYNKSSLLTINEIKKSLFNYLGIWNSVSRESETTSRDSNFESGEFKDALPIAHQHIARLFWKHDERKFERQRFQLNNLEYELLSFDHAMKLSSEDYDIFSNDSIPDFVYVFNKNGDYIGKPTLKPTWLNDPKRIPDSDRKQIDKRRKDRKSIILKMKQNSKFRSKKLEEIRSKDPQIMFYLNQKKEESTKRILNVIEYNFQLTEVKDLQGFHSDFHKSENVNEEFISKGISINP